MKKYKLMAIIALVILTGCSGSIATSKIADDAADAKAKGLRYFLPQRVEISAYQVTMPEKVQPAAKMIHRIDRIGDVVVDTINDPQELWQVTYQGALFANQGVTLNMNDKGAVKSIGLTGQGGTPAALGALQAVQTALGIPAKNEQAKIDELNRQTNLIKAKNDLEKALSTQ
jgi:uncharacterized protein YcfL